MLFPDLEEGALQLRRADRGELLGTYSDHPFELEGKTWPTVEHYFQSMKFTVDDPDYGEQIRLAATPEQARKLGRKNKRKLRQDWKTLRRIVMTRGLYTKCRTYSNIAQTLLDTGSRSIIENSQYDYFWGCGRDRRGENTFGKVLVDIRVKLCSLSAITNETSQK